MRVKVRSGCVALIVWVLTSLMFATSVARATNDVAFDSQWGLDVIKVSEVWALSTGAGVTVAVIDSGSGPNPDLTQNLIVGRSIVRGRIGDSSSDVDLVGHGTHVAGIIAGQS
ncbi:MAG: hypothetical protein EBS27_02510, partial [Actinobacteria bacterium]|nr:hypothetical protein [Actinomycetota bacterium]